MSALALGLAVAAHSHAATSLQPHQQRVLDEKTDLDARLARLLAVTDNPGRAETLGIPAAELERMRRQAVLMAQLSAVLGERIAAFPTH